MGCGYTHTLVFTPKNLLFYQISRKSVFVWDCCHDRLLQSLQGIWNLLQQCQYNNNGHQATVGYQSNNPLLLYSAVTLHQGSLKSMAMVFINHNVHVFYHFLWPEQVIYSCFVTLCNNWLDMPDKKHPYKMYL